MLTHSLNGHGYTNVLTANDGSQALQMTYDLKPDLIILDLMMPSMDGFAYCKAIRQNKDFDHMPIIVQTALSEMEQKLKAFQLGASDYISKPIDPGEIAARTKVHLIQKLLMQDLRSYRQRINIELDAARNMQTRLMPSPHLVQMCERVFDMKIAQHFETSSELGGDCWGFRPLSDNRLAIFMYDFSGHGITAAMNVFRMHTIMQEFMHAGGEPGNFLTTINRHLYTLLERDEFATMFYGIIDTDANCLLYASAAAPTPMLFTRTQAEPVLLNNRSFPLGVVPGAMYETKYTPFSACDLLLLFSDGLIESKNAEGKFISEEQLQSTALSALREEPPNPAGHALSALVHLFKTHSSVSIRFPTDVECDQHLLAQSQKLGGDPIHGRPAPVADFIVATPGPARATRPPAVLTSVTRALCVTFQVFQWSLLRAHGATSASGVCQARSWKDGKDNGEGGEETGTHPCFPTSSISGQLHCVPNNKAFALSSGLMAALR